MRARWSHRLVGVAASIVLCLAGSTVPASASAVGGFSAGSWSGSPAPSSSYSYGILESGGEFTGSSNDCTYPNDKNTTFGPGIIALNKDGDVVNAFMFLTSWYWWQHNGCTGDITSAGDWGLTQADYFIDALNASGYGGIINRVFSDDETGLGSDWTKDSSSNNIEVILNFNDRLCGTYSLCNLGIYTGYYMWPTIVGSSDPNVGTNYVWLASYGPSQTEINTQEDWFTVSPGGYYMYSWQYANDSCQMTYSSAQTEANNASPAIPKFDKWTNSQPNVVC